MIKRLKLISLVTTVSFFLLFFVIKVFFTYSNFYGPFLESFYWLWFVLIVNISWVFGLKSEHVLYSSLIFMTIGAIFNIFGKMAFGETILRMFVVIFLVGIGLLLIESGKSFFDKKND